MNIALPVIGTLAVSMPFAFGPLTITPVLL